MARDEIHKEIYLKYGRSQLTVTLPQKNLLGVLLPKSTGKIHPKIAESPEGLIENALSNPWGSMPIEYSVRPGMTVSIIVSDITRPSPTFQFLPPILKRLLNAGVNRQDISIVFGMGIHRNHTEEEKRLLVGDDIYRRYRCVDSSEDKDYVYLGTTSFGTPVEIARVVAQADFRICTGNIEFHYFAGYSGGAKALMPGCASRRSVEANHAMQLKPMAVAGSYDNNPVRQDMEEAGRMIGADFILNAVLDDEKRIINCVAGHAEIAHSIGRQVVDDTYGTAISERSDIVLASCGGYPKDLDLYQAQKALNNAARAVKPQGTIILLAECSDGFGNRLFEEYMTKMSLDEIILAIQKQFVLGGHKAAAVARVLKQCDVFLITGMERALVEASGFSYATSPAKALQSAFENLGEKSTIWAMPYAGSTVPLLPSEK